MGVDRAAIGREQPGGTLAVTRGRLRDFARATGQTDPAYLDVDAARAAGHPDVPAPPTFVFSAEFEGTDPFAFLVDLGVDLRTVLHGEQEFRYHAMVYAGDELTVRGRIVDIYERKGGALEFIVRESAVINQHGDLIAEMRSTTIVQHPEVAG
jgi:acyl dehydratase